MRSRKAFGVVVGDFVCVNNRNMWENSLYFQAIGRVAERDSSSLPHFTVEFPKYSDTPKITLSALSLRRASAYEGMMAFWDPAAENARFFASTAHKNMRVGEEPDELRVETRRIAAAKEKADQASLTVDDL